MGVFPSTTMSPYCMLLALCGLVIHANCFILDTHKDTDRHVVHRIWTSRAGIWGDWGDPEFCPNGTYARGFHLKIEDFTTPDNTEVNGIQLSCYRNQNTYPGDYPRGSIRSAEGPWGHTNFPSYEGVTCKSYDEFFTAFRLNVQPIQNTDDDSAVNNVRFECRNFDNGTEYELNYPKNGPDLGMWGPKSTSCPDDSAICGLSTRIEAPLPAGGDDTALNDVIFYCCDD